MSAPVCHPTGRRARSRTPIVRAYRTNATPESRGQTTPLPRPQRPAYQKRSCRSPSTNTDKATAARVTAGVEAGALKLAGFKVSIPRLNFAGIEFTHRHLVNCAVHGRLAGHVVVVVPASLPWTTQFTRCLWVNS